MTMSRSVGVEIKAKVKVKVRHKVEIRQGYRWCGITLVALMTVLYKLMCEG